MFPTVDVAYSFESISKRLDLCTLLLSQKEIYNQQFMVKKTVACLDV